MGALREKLARVGRAMITDYRGVTVAVAAAMVVLAIVYGPRVARDIGGAPDLEGPWADTARCLVGDMREDETAGERYRDAEIAHGIELRYVASVEGGGIAEGAWPHTCLPAVRALAEAADDAELTELAATAARVADAFDAGSSATSDAIDTLWRAATAELGAPGASDVPGPGAPHVPRGLAPFAEGARAYGTFVTSGPVHLIPYEAYAGCVVGGDDPDVRCLAYPDVIPRRPGDELRPVQTDHPEDVFVNVERDAGDGGGIYSLATGERVLAAGAARYTAMVAADGRAAAVSWDRTRRDGAYLTVRHPDATTSRVPLDPRVDKPDVAWSWLVYDVAGPGGARKIVARRITWSDPPLGPVVELGSRPAWSRRELSMCVDGDRVFALYHGARGEADYAVIALGDDAAWMHPVEHRGHLSCDGGVARVVSVTTGDRVAVHESRCDAGGCRHREVALDSALSSSDHADAVALGDEVALVWVDDLVRARIAPLDELAAAPAVAAYDGFAAANARPYASLVHAVFAYRAGDDVVVTIHSGEGGQAVRLERDGTVTGLGVDRVQAPPTASPPQLP